MGIDIDWSGSFINGYKTASEVVQARERHQYEMQERQRQQEYQQKIFAAGKDVEVSEVTESSAEGGREVQPSRYNNSRGGTPESVPARTRFQVGDKMFDNRDEANRYAAAWNDPVAKFDRLYNTSVQYGDTKSAQMYQEAYKGYREISHGKIEENINNMLLSGNFEGLGKIVGSATGSDVVIRMDSSTGAIITQDKNGNVIDVSGNAEAFSKKINIYLNRSSAEQVATLTAYSNMGATDAKTGLTNAQTSHTQEQTKYVGMGALADKMRGDAAMLSAQAQMKNASRPRGGGGMNLSVLKYMDDKKNYEDAVKYYEMHQRGEKVPSHLRDAFNRGYIPNNYGKQGYIPGMSASDYLLLGGDGFQGGGGNPVRGMGVNPQGGAPAFNLNGLDRNTFNNFLPPRPPKGTGQ